MSRYLTRLDTPQGLARLAQWAREAPPGWVGEIREVKRSTDANAALHAMLSIVAKQKQYHGLWLSVDDWKILMMDALNRETRMVPNLDGTGLVSLGRSTSKLTRSEFRDLLALVEAYAAQEGLELNEGKEG